MLESNSSSVYNLVIELCINLLREYNPQNPINPTSVNKLKSKSYEILLKKSKNYQPSTSIIIDPIRELDIILFATKIKAQYDHNKLKTCNSLEKHIEFISNEEYFNSDNDQHYGNAILIFLLNLKTQISDTKLDQVNSLLMPGPFTLYSEYDKNSTYYPSRSTVTSTNLNYFPGFKPLLNYKNPYLPQFLFQEEIQKLPSINQYQQDNNQQPSKQLRLFNDYLQFTTTNSIQTINNKSMLTPLKILKPVINLNNIHSQVNITCCYNPSTKYSSQSSFGSINSKHRLSWDWEHLGSSTIILQKPFVSETVTSLHIQNIIAETLGKKFIPKTIPINKFISDVKLLSVGIQSDCFHHDEFMIFHMSPEITINSVSTIAMENYINFFLDCGTSYKRLQVILMKNNYKLMFDGFIFKALCSAVENYLLIFRKFVFSYDDKEPLSLFKRMKKMMEQIRLLAYTLAIHPNCDANFKPPIGSQFLGHLYTEILDSTKKDFTMLLVYILKRCCHVYFKHLHEWIFYGKLDDSANELFICNAEHYRPLTKYYYDKAYFIRKELVPAFFKGSEDDILLCGKYTMLLQNYNSSHPLFNLEYPSISVCLLNNEIEQMEKQCNKYIKNAEKVCQSTITVHEIFTQKAKRRKEFFELVSNRAKLNHEKWIAEQLETAANEKATKRKRLDEVKSQLIENRDRKTAERAENIASERFYLKEIQRKEDREIELENEIIKKRIEYYQELGKLIDNRHKNRDIYQEDSHLNLNDDNAVDSASASSAHTEFSSCNDDDEDEVLSNYKDCPTPSKALPLIPDQNDEINSIQEEEDEEEKIVNEEEVKLDVINSNTESECQRNRDKIMSSNPKNYFHETELCVATSSVHLDATENIKSKKTINLSDAEKNKLKVLTEEYGVYGTNEVDVNSNSVHALESSITVVPELTDLQKNRFKMMQTDTFAEFSKDPFQMHNLNLDLTTERSKNRKKVLESEFDILTGQVPGVVVTPMSTTSDTGPLLDEETLKRTEDIKNANLIKIQVDNLDLSELNLNIATASIDETPSDGLNTAGVMLKKGFEFPTVKNESTNCEFHINSNNDNGNIMQNETSIENETTPLENDPYQRCKEILNSNFKCKPLSSYFELKDFHTTTNSDTTNSKIQLNQMLINDNRLKNLNELTITEFLQKSVLTPLNAHLKILNNEVMRVFLIDLDIISHLRSLRNFFFLMDGEFGSIICDRLISKLEKNDISPAELLNYQTLHAILDTAISSSIMGNDKNADNLSFIVNDLPESFDLNSPSCLEQLGLCYRVNWPLNLILNPETLEQYANIFKYLLKVRRISWLLEESFNLLKETLKKNGKIMLQSPQYRRVQQIRHKIYQFVHSLINHITSNALQASWKTFKDELLTAKSIEDIYRKHTRYIKGILFLCMLNKRSIEFSNTIENIFKVSIRFYRNLKAREWKKKDANDIYYKHSRYEKLLLDEIDFEKLIKYTIYLGNKIVKHGYQQEIGEFITLLNYNYYYVADE